MRGNEEIVWRPRFPAILFWTLIGPKKSDIYDLGHVIKGVVYGNAPITNLVEWPVLPPLSSIVEACTRESPYERPSLEELYIMVDGIDVADFRGIK